MYVDMPPNGTSDTGGPDREGPNPIPEEDGDAWEYKSDDLNSVTRNDPHHHLRKYYLNPSSTRLHNVRAEPFIVSPIVGQLMADQAILASAECGQWLRVKFHRRVIPKEEMASSTPPATPATSVEGSEGFGWCLQYDDCIRYLIPENERGYQSSASNVSRADSMAEEVMEVWYELRDPAGELYFFNRYVWVLLYGSWVFVSHASYWNRSKWFLQSIWEEDIYCYNIEFLLEECVVCYWYDT